jgi:hypothetical protein
MMISAEMMEQLGGKRGKARGPDMTNVVVSEAADEPEAYAGASSLEDAVGDWEDGRRKKKKKKAREREVYDHACDRFRGVTEKLQTNLTKLQAYVAGLQQMCECHVAMARGSVEALAGLDGMDEEVREYHAAALSWSDTAVPTSLYSRMRESVEMMVVQPFQAHLEVRRELEGRLTRKRKADEWPALIREVGMVGEAMPAAFRGPFEAFRRCQIDFMSAAAVTMGGGEDALHADAAAGPTRRGRRARGGRPTTLDAQTGR